MCVRVCVRVVGWEEGGIRGLAFTRAPRAPRAPTRRSVLSIPGEVGHWGAELQTPLNGGAAGCGLGPEPRALLFLLYPGAFPGTGRQVPAEGPLGLPHKERGAVAEGTVGWPPTPRLTHREDGPLLRPLVAVLEEAVAVGGRGGVLIVLLLGGGGAGRRKGKTREKKEYVTTENPGAMESLPPLFPLSLAGVWLGSAQLLHSHVRGVDALGCQV